MTIVPCCSIFRLILSISCVPPCFVGTPPDWDLVESGTFSVVVFHLCHLFHVFHVFRLFHLFQSPPILPQQRRIT